MKIVFDSLTHSQYKGLIDFLQSDENKVKHAPDNERQFYGILESVEKVVVDKG